jgi:hypothetical protein
VSLTAGIGITLTGTTVAVEDAIIPQYSTGVQAPAAACTAGREIYTDTAAGVLYFCSATDQWKAVSSTSHSHTAGQVTGLAASATVDTTNAANITSGVLPLARGGTGRSGWTAGRCVQVSADGQQLEAGAKACGPGGSPAGSYGSLTAATCDGAAEGWLAAPADSYYDLLRCDGAGTWEHFRGGRKVTPPPATGWVWVNQGAATAAEAGGAWHLDLPADTGGNNLRALTRAIPGGTPRALSALVECDLMQTGNRCGLVLRETLTGKLIFFGLARTGPVTAQAVVTVDRYDDPAAAPAAVAALAAPAGARGVWLRIEDDGTNRKYWISQGGLRWKLAVSESRADFLIADEWGLGGEAANAAMGPGVSLVVWEVQ